MVTGVARIITMMPSSFTPQHGYFAIVRRIEALAVALSQQTLLVLVAGAAATTCVMRLSGPGWRSPDCLMKHLLYKVNADSEFDFCFEQFVMQLVLTAQTRVSFASGSTKDAAGRYCVLPYLTAYIAAISRHDEQMSNPWKTKTTTIAAGMRC